MIAVSNEAHMILSNHSPRLHFFHRNNIFGFNSNLSFIIAESDFVNIFHVSIDILSAKFHFRIAPEIKTSLDKFPTSLDNILLDLSDLPDLLDHPVFPDLPSPRPSGPPGPSGPSVPN